MGFSSNSIAPFPSFDPSTASQPPCRTVVTLGCQSAQKSSFLPPAQAEAPALVASNGSQIRRSSSEAKSAPARRAPAETKVAQALQVDPDRRPDRRVEKEYQAGQDNYKDGHMEAAKQNFDNAFNQLLGSGFDLKADDRLQHELDRLLDGVNNLELAALQQGDGFAEQKSEPAPIDEANELNPTADANVKAKAEAEIKSTHSDLPLVMTDQVAGFINYFSGRGRGTLERGLARSGRYDDMIRRVLREEGVPQDSSTWLRPNPDSILWLFLAPEPVACGSSWAAAPKAMDSNAAGGSMNARIPKKPPAPPRITCTIFTTNSETGTWPWPPTTPAPEQCRARSSAPDTSISGNSTTATCCRKKRATTFPSFWPSPLWPRIPRSMD